MSESNKTNKTKKLYYETPYKKEFKAEVLSVDRINPTGWGIILDQTLFYPESGGQPADSGSLEGLKVLDVYENQETVIHVLNKELKMGKKIQACIDWDRRFDHMQQHSGQHILSQCFSKLKGAVTVGFHIGRQHSTIDIDREEIMKEDLARIENLANRIVMENRDIHLSIIDRDQAATVALRKFPRDQNKLRVVSIQGFDSTACCGTHVKKTGEIGIIKIIKSENYKEGKRITFLCGWRSLKDYQQKDHIISTAAQLLTCNTIDVIENIKNSKKNEKMQRKRISQLLQKKTEYECNELWDRAEELREIKIIHKVFLHRDSSEINEIIKKLTANKKVLVIFGIKSQSPMLFIARSRDIDIDVVSILKPASRIFNGRGGGSPFMAQAKGKNSNKIEEAVEQAKGLAENIIIKENNLL